jgi:hypothetical protein
VRESNFILSPNLMSHNDLVDIIELVPILILILQISKKRLKFRASRDRHI